MSDGEEELGAGGGNADYLLGSVRAKPIEDEDGSGADKNRQGQPEEEELGCACGEYQPGTEH
ncbi:hypothetical protein D9M68_642040 [compost metagenome]